MCLIIFLVLASVGGFEIDPSGFLSGVVVLPTLVWIAVKGGRDVR